MIGENGPPMPDWAPRCRCGDCNTCEPPPTIPPTIILGEN